MLFTEQLFMDSHSQERQHLDETSQINVNLGMVLELHFHRLTFASLTFHLLAAETCALALLVTRINLALNVNLLSAACDVAMLTHLSQG
jgi:type VI protein secretion system component VasA